MAATGIVGGDPNKVSKAGDTMTGPLVLSGDPAADLEAAEKEYVDSRISLQGNGWFNIRSYGAAGNGTADDTAAIQAAITAASSGGTVYLPRGTYKLTAALTVHNGVTLLGDGDGATILNQTSTSANGVSGTDLTHVSLLKLAIQGPGSGTGYGVQFTLTSANALVYLRFEEVMVSGFGANGIDLANPIVSTFSRVISANNGGHGFNLFGKTFPSAAGTSCALVACYANANQQAGYRLYNMVYSTMNACAADANGIGYLLDTCQALSLNGCGAESQANHGASWPGTSYKITGGYGVGLHGCWVYQNNQVGISVTGNATAILLDSCMDNTPGGSAVNFVKVDAGCHATMLACHNTSANDVASSTTSVLDDTAGGMSVAGPIGIGGDTSIYRSGTATLRTDATLVIGNAAVLKFGPSADVNLYRAGANEIGTDSSFAIGTALQHWGNQAGFFGTSAVSKPTVSGSKGSGAALTSLLAALAALGLITDSTSS